MGPVPCEPGSSSRQSDGDDNQDSDNDKDDRETDSDPNRNGRELLGLTCAFSSLASQTPCEVHAVLVLLY